MACDDGAPPRSRDENLEYIAGQLPGLRRQLRRAHHRELVLLLLVLAGAVAAALWAHHSDDIRARNHQENLARIARLEQQSLRVQAQNTEFRQHICLSITDWQRYLALAPAGPPAGQRARDRLIISLDTLCPGARNAPNGG